MYGFTHILSHHSPNEEQVSRGSNYDILEEGITNQLMEHVHPARQWN